VLVFGAHGLLIVNLPIIQIRETETLVASVPSAESAPGRYRISSLDLLRGIVMVLMTLDHTRDYFHAYSQHLSPTNLSTTTEAIFLTRWVTHFCAPVFVFLAGAAIFLKRSRGASDAEMTHFLSTRGCLLVVLEMTVVRFGWDFTLRPYAYAQIIWTIGCCMILLHYVLPLRGVRVLIAVVLLLASSFVLNLTGPSTAWTIFWGSGTVFTPSGAFIVFKYPILRWFAVMWAGYAFGKLLLLPDARRSRTIFRIGALLTASFLLLRSFNLLDVPWSVQKSASFTVLSFINCTKLPASLPYFLMTLGPVLLAWPLYERCRGGFARILTRFGRVPLLFYLLHLYVIHLLAVLVTAIRGQSVSWVLPFTPFFRPPQSAEFGFGLGFVFLMVLVTLVLMYPACCYFDNQKRKRSHPWLSYF